MAHKIIAADLGSSSMKLARFEATFRKVQLIDVRTIEVHVDGKPEERLPKQLAVLAQTMAQDRYVAEEVAIGLPGEALMMRLVDLPFSNPRQIEQTLGYELESEILTPLDELVVDFVVVGPSRLGGVAATGGETRVLAACAPRTLVAAVVKAAQELGLPLRSIGASPLAYAAYLSNTGMTSATGEPVMQPTGTGTSLVVDVGSDTTTLCAIRDGKPEMARTIARGGRAVTQAIAAGFRLDDRRAEDAKRTSAFVAHSGLEQLTQAQAKMNAAVQEALTPLVRELRQTIASYRAAYGDAVDRVLVCGGGSRLSGFPEFLSEELALPVAPVPWVEREGWLHGPTIADRQDMIPVALGLGLATTAQGLQTNFRRGEFAYRSDYSFLRDKAVYIGVATAFIMAFALINATVSYRGLQKEHDLLAVQYKKATVEVFGKERAESEATQVSEEMKRGPKGVGALPIPSMTAFDLLDEISRAAPTKGKIDITVLDIKPKKTSVEGTAESAQQVDDFADALKKNIECFEDVQKGRLTTTTVQPPYVPPGSDSGDKDKKDSGPKELKQFTLSIRTSCP